MKKMYESGEDYLETIYILSKRQSSVHAIDIAREKNFSKPSITRAMNILKDQGFIIIDKMNHIKLTKSGLEEAQRIYNRHLVLTDFLLFLGVDGSIAEKDACRIEHIISEETFNTIENFLQKHKN